MHKVVPKRPAIESAVLTHLMVDIYDLDPGILDDADRVTTLLTEAAGAARLRPLDDPVVYRYPGQGLTVFLPICESHFAIHTYPEHGYASADIVSCADEDRARRACDFLLATLEAERFETRIARRGFPETGGQ